MNLNKFTKQNITHAVLWLAYGLALAASLKHVAWAFGTLEFEGQQWNGWLAALAVDAGLAALAYAIQQRRRAKRPVWTLWLGISLFAGISAFANLLHAMAVQVNGQLVTVATFSQVDALALAKAIVLSATLPLLVVYLGEIVSSDDAVAIAEAEQEAKRIERQTKRSTVQPKQLPVQVEQTPVQVGQPEPSNVDDQNSNGQSKTVQPSSKAEAVDALLKHLDKHPHDSLEQAGKVIGRSKSTVGNYVKELKKAGQLIEQNGSGWKVNQTS